jgi:hypothetical protein
MRFRDGRGRFSFEHGDLPSQSEDFKRGIHAATEKDTQGCEECGIKSNTNPLLYHPVTPADEPGAADRKVLI